MRFHWVKNRVFQNQFEVKWLPAVGYITSMWNNFLICETIFWTKLYPVETIFMTVVDTLCSVGRSENH